MSDMRSIIEKLTAISEDRPTVGDGVFLEFGNVLEVDTEIMEMDGESITLLGDEKLLGLLESLGAIESKYLGEAKLWRAHDFGGKRYVDHYRDNYFIATSEHQGDDVRKVVYHLLKKMVKTDDEMTPAYQEIATLDVSPYNASRNEINQAAERAIANKGSVSEGEVVPFRRPENRGDMQNLNAAKQIIRDMYWVGYMDETPDLPSLSEYKQELNKIGYDVNIKFNSQTQEDYAILTNRTTNERYTMDENDLIGESLYEAEYQGRKVQLNKPHRGDVKKFAVFVKDPKTGNVKKVNFGDPNMRIKKSNPKRRKSFRARHKCHTAKDKTTARYWSCRKW
jgi:hypothetical protein